MHHFQPYFTVGYKLNMLKKCFNIFSCITDEYLLAMSFAKEVTASLTKPPLNLNYMGAHSITWESILV